MANITETPSYSTGVYQIDTHDQVRGGVDGVINVQAKQLANRTAWLKQQVEAAGATATGADTKATNALAQIAAVEQSAGSAVDAAAEALAHKTAAQAAEALAVQAKIQAQAAQAQASDNATYAVQAAGTAQLKASEAQAAATAAVAAVASMVVVLQTPSLQNSWTDFGGSRLPARYYKDKFGTVVFQGSIKNASPISGGESLLFQLPAGYRPAGIVRFPVMTINGTTPAFGSVTIDSDGYVYANAGGVTEFALDGIFFRTAA